MSYFEQGEYDEDINEEKIPKDEMESPSEDEKTVNTNMENKLKITIWVELGQSTDGEFHRFKEEFDNLEGAEQALARLVASAEKLQKDNENPN